MRWSEHVERWGAILMCATNVLEDEGYLVHLLFKQRILDEFAEHKSNMLVSSSWYPDKIPCEEWEPKLPTEYKEELSGDKKRFEEMQIMHPHKKTRSKTSSTPKWQQLEMPIIKGSQLKEGTWNTRRGVKVHRTDCERHVKKQKSQQVGWQRKMQRSKNLEHLVQQARFATLHTQHFLACGARLSPRLSVKRIAFP